MVEWYREGMSIQLLLELYKARKHFRTCLYISKATAINEELLIKLLTLEFIGNEVNGQSIE